VKFIIVPIDFSEISNDVVEKAVEVAKAFRSRLRVIHVTAPDPFFVGYDVGPQSVRNHRAEELREEHHRLEEICEQIGRQEINVENRMIQGPTVEKILEQAAELNADLIIMGSHGRGVLSRALLGSVSQGVLHQSTIPVMIVPPRAR
jgi:nucleotide-binding universal stress UspA family protein